MDWTLRVGRYALYGVIGSGGMATVHFGRMVGAGGFKRTVAIKRLHPHLVNEAELVEGLLDEALLASRIRHPNVVATLDVVREANEVFVVMEYVAGESLSRLLKASRRDGVLAPASVVVSIVNGALQGLHAAHDATRETGEPLHIVHRDVSPQNIVVGSDGITRVLDFGVAKAVGRMHSTQDGQIKGKLPYMAPEQLRGGMVDRRTDVFAAGIVLWEALTGEMLFAGDNAGVIVTNVSERPIRRPSELVPGLPTALDAVVMRALEREPSKRFSSARQMAQALEAAVTPATHARVEAWVRELADDALSKRAREVAAIESETIQALETPLATPFSSVERTVTTTLERPQRSRMAILASLALLFVVGSSSVLLLARAREPIAAGTEPAIAPPPRPSASSVTTAETSLISSRSAAPSSSSGSAPSSRPASKPVRRGARPASPTSPSSVVEYVGADGVTRFCRPPNCPK